MKIQIVIEEFELAKEKKTWIYRTPPPPNKMKPRALRRGKITVIFDKERSIENDGKH